MKSQKKVVVVRQGSEVKFKDIPFEIYIGRIAYKESLHLFETIDDAVVWIAADPDNRKIWFCDLDMEEMEYIAPGSAGMLRLAE